MNYTKRAFNMIWLTEISKIYLEETLHSQSSLHWKVLALYIILMKNLPFYNTVINLLRES